MKNTILISIALLTSLNIFAAKLTECPVLTETDIFKIPEPVAENAYFLENTCELVISYGTVASTVILSAA